MRPDTFVHAEQSIEPCTSDVRTEDGGYQQGKRDDARELLFPIHRWFTEEFDTRDLKDPKTLLEKVS